MKRQNPLVLTDKEYEFLYALNSWIRKSAGKPQMGNKPDYELLNFITNQHTNNENVFLTNFSFEWQIKSHPGCTVELDLAPVSEAFTEAGTDVDDIGKIYSRYGVLIDKGWVPEVEGFFVEFLEVNETCRGKGHGKEVLQQLLTLATRYDIHLFWTFDKSVKENNEPGSKAIQNLKAWYEKAGALFSPIASELELYDFVYPDYVLPPYQGLNLSEEPIQRLNPSDDLSIGVFLERFPRKWWYTNEDWRILVNAIQRQYNDPSYFVDGQFQADEFELNELDTILAEERLINILESRGCSMIGLSADFVPIAYGIGETSLVMHFGQPVEVFDSVLVQEDNMADRPWSLFKFLGYIDQDTDIPAYELIKTELAEEYLEKLLPDEYAEYLEDHGVAPLEFPTRSNRGVSSVKIPKKVIRDSKGRKIPERYLKGYKGKKLTQRKKEIEQRRDEYKRALKKYGDEADFPKTTLKKLYRPFKTDKGIKSKPSSYTVEAKKRGFTGSLANKAKQASKYYKGKIPKSILEQVRKRGMAAWASGGHRPGQTSHSWGNARVNSFLVGGKTFFTADKGLASQLPKNVQAAIKKKRHWKG